MPTNNFIDRDIIVRTSYLESLRNDQEMTVLQQFIYLREFIMTSIRKMEIGLATIRITTAAFFLVWSIEKIVAPEIAQKVFTRFYASTISPGVSMAIGILQTAIVLLFLAGLFKLWTYGAILGMHALSTLSTYEPLLNPYTLPNHLFWAAVPTLGAIFALFLMRKEDQLLTFSEIVDGRSKHQNAEML